jgi:hypothetical protein
VKDCRRLYSNAGHSGRFVLQRRLAQRVERSAEGVPVITGCGVVGFLLSLAEAALAFLDRHCANRSGRELVCFGGILLTVVIEHEEPEGRRQIAVLAL